MQKRAYLRLCLLFFISLLVACGHKPDAIDSMGENIYFKNYANKWLILNYWAPWCKPCFEEIPAFNQLFQHHQDKVMILGISFDDLTHDKINIFKEQFNISYPLLVTNPGPLFNITQIPHLPATFLISPDRKKTIALYGQQTEESLLKIILSGVT